jgi:hypothetical protein
MQIKKIALRIPLLLSHAGGPEEIKFNSWRRPCGLFTPPTAAPQFYQFGSCQSQQSFTANKQGMENTNVNDYFVQGNLAPSFPLVKPCFSWFRLSLSRIAIFFQ